MDNASNASSVKRTIDGVISGLIRIAERAGTPPAFKNGMADLHEVQTRLEFLSADLFFWSPTCLILAQRKRSYTSASQQQSCLDRTVLSPQTNLPKQP